MFETNLHIINKDIMLNSVVSIQKMYIRYKFTMSENLFHKKHGLLLKLT